MAIKTKVIKKAASKAYDDAKDAAGSAVNKHLVAFLNFSGVDK